MRLLAFVFEDIGNKNETNDQRTMYRLTLLSFRRHFLIAYGIGSSCKGWEMKVEKCRIRAHLARYSIIKPERRPKARKESID